eukprot:PITA_24591
MGECVAIEPSSFKEAIQQLVWVDAMVEEYDSIVCNSVWDVVPRLEDKLVVSSHWIYKLKRALYGLKESPHTYYTIIDSYFTGLCFTKSEVDVNLNHIVVEGKLLIIVLYVDDLILISDDQLIKSCKEDLTREFEMEDMGLMHYFLGMEVWQGDGELFVSHDKYANEILMRFRIERSKPMETPLAGNRRNEDATSLEVVEATVYRQLLGSLMYFVKT